MLPKIAIPTFELELPSTKELIIYRPFLVKEEKILLIAKQSGERSDIINAIKQVISNCIINEDFDVNKIAVFDMEYLFIKIRSISVGNEIEFSVEDSTDHLTYNFKLDLNDVEITYPENVEQKIMINEDLGVMMKYPTMDLSDKIAGVEDVVDIAFETIKHCIDYVFDRENMYNWQHASVEEREEFLESLNPSQYEKLSLFFQNIPKIEHVYEYTNSMGEEKKVYFRKIEDFFHLG